MKLILKMWGGVLAFYALLLYGTGLFVVKVLWPWFACILRANGVKGV